MVNKKTALISCSKTKALRKCSAKEMYQGALFCKAFQFCSKEYDNIYILSAKYGLLDIDTEIDPYDQTLNNMFFIQRKEWGLKVNQQLKERNIFYPDIYADDRYCEFIKGYRPLLGLSLGQQLKWFNDQKNKGKGFEI